MVGIRWTLGAQRLTFPRDRGRGGAGLGLALVVAVAAAHQGSVEVMDSPLGGARFELQLPKRA